MTQQKPSCRVRGHCKIWKRKIPLNFAERTPSPKEGAARTQGTDTWRTNSPANAVSADSLPSARLRCASQRFSQTEQEQFAVDVSCPGFPRAQLGTLVLVPHSAAELGKHSPAWLRQAGKATTPPSEPPAAPVAPALQTSKLARTRRRYQAASLEHALARVDAAFHTHPQSPWSALSTVFQAKAASLKQVCCCSSPTLC